MSITNLPVELLLQICNYMDTTNFYNFTDYLKNEDNELHRRLMRLICSSTIRYDYRIKLMNNLFLNIDYFRKQVNYIDFKAKYTNNFELPYFYKKNSDLSFDSVMKTEIYRKYILEEKIQDENKKKIFFNLTKSFNSFDDLIEENYHHPTKNFFKFKNKAIRREDVFNFTYM